ncbi:MAG TPA: TonB family protein [Candidatus Acidoferrum sp.]|nr:TonB family protein [Candidatus Acidoferrum sp.]
MSEAWKQWEGQVVDGLFPLRQYLGGSDHSAVFVTEHGEREPEKAAIKLILADPANAELQISRWKHAAQLFHPHLLRLSLMGRCEMDNVALLYLVMEYADENLSQILSQRPLTPEETRDVLMPVLDALACVHRQGFVFGHLKPSNIMAVADKIKLSTDGLLRTTETVRVRKPGVYDPPEAPGGRFSPARDVWSLGMTLVETLTQRVPVWERIGHGDPILPKSLPSPFFDIARNCLRRDPQLRSTIADISARLRPTSSVPRTPVSSAPAPQSISAPPRPVMKAPKKAAPQRPISIPRFALPLLVAVLAVAAIITVPKLLSRRPEPQKTSSVDSENSTPQPRAQPKSEKAPASPRSTPTPPSAQQSVQKSLKTASDKQPIKKEEASAVPEPSPVIAPSEEQPKASATAVVPGEVLSQVLPDVSQKARDTIRGRVRVRVKVHVDPSGDLAGAELDSPGPSKYFADLALQAARRWEFAPAKVDGSNVSTDWIVRFEFSQLNTKVFPVQTSPR